MRMTWKTTLAAALACGALAACGGNASDPAADSRRAQDDRAGTRRIAVTGCVATAPGTSGYVLNNVRMAPLPEQPSDAPTAHGGVITEGSWARLRADGDEHGLGDQVGRLVTVVGLISDTGQDMIGTTGPPAPPDQPEARRDASRASSPEHYSDKVAKEAGPMAQQSLANGTAPEIMVERVEPTGKACTEPPRGS